MTKYTLVENQKYDLFCMGVFDNLEEAVGKAYLDIADFSSSYEDEGDEFHIKPVVYASNDSGYIIEITFKSKNWDKPCKHWYHILTYETEDE